MKKIPIHNYAEAFLKTLQKPGINSDEVLKRLIATIKRRNDWPRRNEILSAVEAEWRAARGRSLLTIESARTLTSAQRESLIKRWSNEKFDMREKINPALIAGVKLIVNGEHQLDGSLDRKLRDMFN